MLLTMKPAEFAAYFRRVLPTLSLKPKVSPAGAVAGVGGAVKDRLPALQ